MPDRLGLGGETWRHLFNDRIEQLGGRRRAGLAVDVGLGALLDDGEPCVEASAAPSTGAPVDDDGEHGARGAVGEGVAPGGSIEKTERMWRGSASWRMRSIPGVAENGRFISTTVGWTYGRKSVRASALWWVTEVPGNKPASSPAGMVAISFRCKRPAAQLPMAHSAITASIPVPVDGFSTVSPSRTAAARSAA